MKKLWIVIAVVVLIAFIFFGQYIGVRNTLVAKNEAVKAAWSQVDIVLQRRADLIPNLVETVKGYAQQEQTVFGDIAKARSALLSAGTPRAKDRRQRATDGALGRLLLVVENYPQLKSNENFLRLTGRTRGNRKSHRRRAQALQRHAAGLQHVCPGIPEQYLCRMGGLPTQSRLLRRNRRISPGPKGDLLESRYTGTATHTARSRKVVRAVERGRYLYFLMAATDSIELILVAIRKANSSGSVGSRRRTRSESAFVISS